MPRQVHLICVKSTQIGAAPGWGRKRPKDMRPAAAGEAMGMAKLNPFEFIQEVRTEVARVTWPSWKEVWVTSLMVLMMVVLASLFFLLADQIIGALVKLLLGLGG